MDGFWRTIKKIKKNRGIRTTQKEREKKKKLVLAQQRGGRGGSTRPIIVRVHG